MAMIYTLLALCLTGTAFGQIASQGSCLRVPGEPNFDINRFSGLWYEGARYFAHFEFRGRCTKVNFVPSQDGTIKANKYFISDLTGYTQSYHMDLWPNLRNPSKFAIKFPLSPPGDTSACTIIGTDYRSYAVIYCCTEYGPFNLQYAWIMTRDQYRTQEVMSRAFQVVDRNNVDRKYFWRTDQSCQ